MKQPTNKCLQCIHPADLTVPRGVSEELFASKLLLYHGWRGITSLHPVAYTTHGIQEAETSDHQECGF